MHEEKIPLYQKILTPLLYHFMTTSPWAVCGDCGKSKSAHTKLDGGLLCYSNSDNWYVDYPEPDELDRFARSQFPRIHDFLVWVWKIKNGHLGT